MTERRIMEMANLINGFPFSSDDFAAAGEIPLVRIRDIFAGEFETFVPAEVVPDECIIRDGDVVIGMDGDFNITLWKRGPAALNQRVCLLRARNGVDNRFLAYSLPHHLKIINDLTYSTTVKHLSSGQIQHIRVSAFTFDQQRSIADYLDRETAQIDELIDAQERFVDLLKERRRAIIERSLADTVPTRPGTRLKHLVRSMRQGWSPQCFPWSADGIATWAVLKVGAANGGVFRPDENKELPDDLEPRPSTVVRAGDLVVSRANTRDLVGSAAVVIDNYPKLMLSDKLYALEIDEAKALPGYVAHLMASRQVRDLIEMAASGASSSMLNISREDILNLPMAIPDIAEQRCVIDRLDKATTKIDKLITKTQRHIELAKERKSTLITEAVNGQIDIKEA